MPSKAKKPLNKGRIELEDGRVVCGAKKRDGGLCTQPCISGANRCYMHNGRPSVGPANGSAKDLAYSKLLPAHYRNSFAEHLADPDLSSLKRQVALLGAREEELLGHLPTAESASSWVQVKKGVANMHSAFADLQAGNTTSAGVKMRESMQILSDAIEAGLLNERVWGELIGVMEQKRKLVEAEVRREARLSEVMTPEQLGWLLQRIANIFRDFIRDPKDLRLAVLSLRALIGGNSELVDVRPIAPEEAKLVNPQESGYSSKRELKAGPDG